MKLKPLLKLRRNTIPMLLLICIAVLNTHPSSSRPQFTRAPVSLSQSTNPRVQYDLRINTALDLTKSNLETTRALGWAAIEAILTEIGPGSVIPGTSMISELEVNALRENSIQSLRALIQAYANDNERRYQLIYGFFVGGRLLPPPFATNDPILLARARDRAALAVLAEFYKLPPSPSNGPKELEPRAGEANNSALLIARLIRYRQNAAPPADLTKQIDNSLQGTAVNDITVALLVARFKTVRDTLTNQAVNTKLLAFVSGWKPLYSSPLLSIIALATKDAANMLIRESTLALSVTDLAALARFEVWPELGPRIGDRGVEASALGELTATLRAIPLCADCKRRDVQLRSYTAKVFEKLWRNWHRPRIGLEGLLGESLGESPQFVVLEDLPAVPITSPTIRLVYPGFADPRTSFPLYKCWNGTTEYVGGCYEAFTKVVSDSPGVPPGIAVTSMGIAHRTWFPNPPSLDGESEALSILPKYNLRVGYHPTPETNWIAVRWRGENGTAEIIRATAGVLSDRPVAIEPSTNWALYAVIPGETVNFEATFTSPLSRQDQNQASTLGFTAARPNQDGIELIELNAANCSLFQNIEPAFITAGVNSNGLLSYAASLQKALERNGWFNPQSADSDQAAAHSLSKLAVLAQVSNMDLSSAAILPDPGNPSNNLDLWVARQAFLRKALLQLAHRLFNSYAPGIEILLASEGVTLARVVAAHERMSSALEHMDTLTADYTKEHLSVTSNLLHSLNSLEISSSSPPTDDLIFQDLEHLQAALAGANEIVGNLEEEMETRKEFRCAIIGRYQYSGIDGYLISLSRREVLDICHAER